MSRNPPLRRISANGQVTIGLRYAGRLARIEPTNDGVMIRFEPVEGAAPKKHQKDDEPETIADHLEAAFELTTPEQIRREMIVHGCDPMEIEELFAGWSD